PRHLHHPLYCQREALCSSRWDRLNVVQQPPRESLASRIVPYLILDVVTRMGSK
ncbi:hypothetical protein BCR44DRAFT_1424346, partial [Catenaria anguillulae PL171]